jgi:hypothetical protein
MAKTAVVFCVHHKPWLVMSSLLTTLLQDHQDVDFHFLRQVGDGTCQGKASYAEYRDLVAQAGGNVKLSPFDSRLRELYQLPGRRVVETELENDAALDSGAWYKFIRSGAWRDYEQVLFLGEGALLTRPDTLSAMLGLRAAQGAHSITSGHEQRRVPRSLFLAWNTRNHQTAMAALHDRMIARAFEIFSRDPEFRAVFERWPDTGAPETQHHVTDIFSADRFNALRIRASRRDPAGVERSLDARTRALVRTALQRRDRRLAARALRAADVREAVPPADPVIYVNTRPCRLADVVATTQIGSVRFHTAAEPEWFGCAVLHMFSRELLERFSARLEQFDLYDVLDLPFAATPLEVIWGLLPAWLGYTKWFTDGIHRVRKHFVTGRREDDASTFASYINRYHRGRLCVVPDGDWVRVRGLHPAYESLRGVLAAPYWAGTR